MLANALISLAPSSMKLDIVEIGQLPFFNQDLVLLRHKFLCDGLIDRVQHGHRDKRLTMATVSLRRRVAMEFGMWRSVLSGGAAGSIIFGKARRLEVRGGTRF
jgi:hypothetical protein